MASKKRSLFIIGAGCSRNYDTSHNGIDGLFSPINHDFFTMARLVLLNSKINEGTKAPLENLFKHVCEERGLKYDADYAFLQDPVLSDLEDIMTDIDIDSSLFEKQMTMRNSKHPYSVLVELVAFTISRALRGPPCTLHNKLASMISKDDMIIDFNYDLLLDDALKAKGKLDDLGYNVNFCRVFEGGKWIRPQEETESPDFFKLHGSLNWLKCVECSSIFLIKGFSARAARAFDVDYLSDIRCPQCESEGENIIRLLLPPIQTKEYDTDPYRLLWRRAVRKLKRINRVAFLGYSFSNTDFAIKSLLRQMYHSNPIWDLDIHFMNPSTEPEDRLKKIFPGIRNPTRTESLEEFIDFYPKWR